MRGVIIKYEREIRLPPNMQVSSVVQSQQIIALSSLSDHFPVKVTSTDGAPAFQTDI